MCLDQGHNPVILEPKASRSRVKHSTTEPLHHDANSPGRIAQSVTCLATDACLTAVLWAPLVPYFRGD